MDDSIEGTVKEGNRIIMLGSIQSGESSVSSMGSDRLKVRMTVGFGTSAVLALRPTAPTYGDGREQFETYHDTPGTHCPDGLCSWTVFATTVLHISTISCP